MAERVRHETSGRPIWAEIDLAALRANAREATQRAGGRELIAVVKADAYGHGAVPVARALLEAGCRRLAVLSVGEAVPLRRAGLAAPVLVLGGVHDAEAARQAVALHLTPVVHDAEDLARVAAAAPSGTALPVHVEVDTGMRRMGVPAACAVDLLVRAATTPGVRLEGAFTHLARADEPDLAPSLEQLRRFREILDEARARGAAPTVIHAANSAALLAGEALAAALPEATAVRPGLVLYGVRPAPHLEARLRPVMTLRTRVLRVQTLQPGEGVGYGATWRAEKPTRVATLSAGYADGVPWSSAPGGRIWVGGAARPIVGRVSMDYTAVEIGDAPISVGDEAVVFGQRPGDPERIALSVEEAADAAGTLAYELLVRVGQRVPRILV